MIPQFTIEIINNISGYKSEDELKILKENWVKSMRGENNTQFPNFNWQWRDANTSLDGGYDAYTYFCNYIGNTDAFPMNTHVTQDMVSKLRNKCATDNIDNLFNGQYAFSDIDNMNKLKSYADFLLTNGQRILEYVNDGKDEFGKTLRGQKLNEYRDAANVLISCGNYGIQLYDSYHEMFAKWKVYSDTYWDDREQATKLFNEKLEALDAKDEEPKDASVTTSIEEPINPVEKIEEVSQNVFGSSSNNTYQSVNQSNGESDAEKAAKNQTHTRIYQYIASTINLDEMSVPLGTSLEHNSEINPSTGMHEPAGPEQGPEEIPYKTAGNKSSDPQLGIGISYPLIRINDHYFIEGDIRKFTLETVGFIPTIDLTIDCQYDDMLKDNAIKDGDICSVYFSIGHGTVKSYRGDFQITHVNMREQSQYVIENRLHFRILGELFIPGLYDGSQTFSYSGTSRDAIINCAERLGLGFFFSDPENTNDIQMWYSMSDGEQKDDGHSPIIKYIKDTALHSYKDFNSFFDCWIDPRYAISFINIAQMLGSEGFDEEFDLAVFNSAMTLARAIDGQNRESTAEEKKNKPKPQAKILYNFGESIGATTPFFVKSFAEHNDGSITNRLGLSNTNYYNINNSGITSVDEGSIEIAYSIPVNPDKLKNGFYILGGPGQNVTYTAGENGSYVEQHKSVQGGQLADTQSDSDAENIMQSGNNMLASGNTNKFYETAEGHNTLCNAWLEKKTITVKLNGCNMQVMRGEKIPMLLRDNFNPIQRMMGSNKEETDIYKSILPSCSGWFIIKDIKWNYDISRGEQGTRWETELTLTRREWPIPGYVKNAENRKEAEIVVENNVVDGTAKEAYMDKINNIINKSYLQNGSTEESSKKDSKSTSGDITTNGLTDFMVTIYNDIKEACKLSGKSIKLVSGRRWGCDANGNKVDNPVINDGNVWKYINAAGDVVWYSSKNSKHNTGEAIDIINGQGTTFEEVTQIIINDNKTLYDMLTNGVYLSIEVSKDDTNNTVKHYHIGTLDKTDSASIAGQQKWWQGIISQFGKTTIHYGAQNVPTMMYLTYNK